MPRSHYPMKVTVVTFNMKRGEPVSERQIDLDRVSDRQWLAKHCRWAYQNGMGIQSFSSKDDRGA